MSEDFDRLKAHKDAGLKKEYDTAFAAGYAKGVEDAARAATSARLPKGYQWGHDAMEQFNFGKERAADAIRALSTTPPPTVPAASEVWDEAIRIAKAQGSCFGTCANIRTIEALQDARDAQKETTT